LGHIMNRQKIQITENEVTNTYSNIPDPNGCPNFYPPPERVELLKKQCIDEVIFLPITNEEFNSNDDYHHFGFRYLFHSAMHETISFGPDPMKLGFTQFQLTVNIQRIRYNISGKDAITINRNYDPLHPPRILTISDRSSSIGKTIADLVLNLISEYNHYYLNRHV